MYQCFSFTQTNFNKIMKRLILFFFLMQYVVYHMQLCVVSAYH